MRREMCVCVYSANALACFFWGWRLHAVAADVLETYTPLITASPHRSPGCLTFLDSDGQQRRRPRVLRLFHSSKTKGLPRGSLMRTQAPSRFHPALFIAGKPPRTAVGEAGRLGVDGSERRLSSRKRSSCAFRSALSFLMSIDTR